jgi:TPR repeat protein
VAERLILAPGNTQTGKKRNVYLIMSVFRRMLSALPQRIYMRACYVGCVRTIAKAANMGCCYAAMHLGRFYQKKYSAPIPMIEAKPFFVLAVEYFTLAAQQGLTEAQYMLGVMLLDSPKQTEGKEWLKCAAFKGHVRSQFFLGQLLDNSQKEEAEHWYTLAAKQGHVEAQYILAYRAEWSKKYDEAVSWFRLASPRLVIADGNLFDLLAKHPSLRQGTEIKFFEANARCDRSALKERWFHRKKS